MGNKTYIGEGHYKDDDGNEYMSIWTYKRKHNITSGNNFEDAKKISCDDKFWGNFNMSDEFKKGYIYNVKCLIEYFS